LLGSQRLIIGPTRPWTASLTASPRVGWAWMFLAISCAVGSHFFKLIGDCRARRVARRHLIGPKVTELLPDLTLARRVMGVSERMPNRSASLVTVCASAALRS